MYTIYIPAKVKKQLKLIAQKHKKAIAAAFEELKEDPFSGKPLVDDLIKRYSYRVGKYRIIYTIDKKDKVVTILSAKHRSIVYISN